MKNPGKGVIIVFSVPAPRLSGLVTLLAFLDGLVLAGHIKFGFEPIGWEDHRRYAIKFGEVSEALFALFCW